jgi:predicted GNAT superfamily acetyltransferase
VQARQTQETDLGRLAHLIQSGRDGLPVSHPAGDLNGSPVMIEIPERIGLLQRENPDAAVAWREATRAAFVDAFAAGYVVNDFLRIDQNGQRAGGYLLARGSLNNVD